MCLKFTNGTENLEAKCSWDECLCGNEINIVFQNLKFPKNSLYDIDKKELPLLVNTNNFLNKLGESKIEIVPQYKDDDSDNSNDTEKYDSSLCVIKKTKDYDVTIKFMFRGDYW